MSNDVSQALNLDLGSLVANATLSTTKYPSLPEGDFIYEIVNTQKPQIATAFVADLKNETTGEMHSYYKSLEGHAKKKAAGAGETLSFICAASGYRNLEEFKGDFDAAKRAKYIGMCLGVGPGPLEGRRIRIITTGKYVPKSAECPTGKYPKYSFIAVTE